jgi:hypothetical protein
MEPSEVHSVIGFARNYGSNATARVCDIARPPRDQMNMGMFNRLPCRLSAVHADIEAGPPVGLSQGCRFGVDRA